MPTSMIIHKNYYILTFILFILFSFLPPQTVVTAQDSKNEDDTKIKVPISLMSKVIPLGVDPLETKIDYTMLAGFGAITLGAGVAIHIYQTNAWWAEQG